MDNQELTFLNGQSRLDNLDCPFLILENGPFLIVHLEWTIKNGQSRMDNQEWTIKNGQSRMDNQEWTIKNGFLIVHS